jgi:hypothetical protein
VGRYYKVVFLGLSVAGPDEEARLLKGLQKKFNLTPERAERMLQRVPVVVKKGTSKEEMERYVKAFEEICGKVRLEEEEEEVPDFQETAKTAVPEKRPLSGKTLKCPQCGFEQAETDICVKCGLVISRYESYREMAGTSQAPSQGATSPEKEATWESDRGFLSAFFATLKESLFSPSSFFRKNAAGEGSLSPLVYGVICAIIGFGINVFWDWVAIEKFSHYLALHKYSFNTYLVYSTIALPLKAIFVLLIDSFVTHLCLMIVGGNKGGFRTTFRVVCYSAGAYLFGFIPIIGLLIEVVYTRVLIIIGIREGHGISTGRAVFAILLPLIVAVCLGIIAAIFIPLLFVGSIKLLGGVGV